MRYLINKSPLKYTIWIHKNAQKIELITEIIIKRQNPVSIFLMGIVFLERKHSKIVLRNKKDTVMINEYKCR